MNTNGSVIIAGGGFVGKALALALAQADFDITIIESRLPDRSKPAEFDGRAYALVHSSMRFLSALGLLPGLASGIQPICRIRLHERRVGERSAPEFVEFGEEGFDDAPMAQMAEDRHLRATLDDAVNAASSCIRVLAPRRIVDQDAKTGSIDVRLDSGERLSAQILVGCDGRRSGVARRAGIQIDSRAYNQAATVCGIDHDAPHGNTAYQLFYPGGPLAVLPLKGRRSTIVWTDHLESARDIQTLSNASFLEVLRDRLAGIHGDIARAGKRGFGPLSLSTSRSIVAERVALAGDAIRGIHPLAGLGLNHGLRDAAVLAEVLTDARRRGEDIGGAGVLARYRQWRQFDSTAVVAATHGLNLVFSNDIQFLRAGRRFGLTAIGKSRQLKRLLIREAAGALGDLPRLMRGRPL